MSKCSTITKLLAQRTLAIFSLAILALSIPFSAIAQNQNRFDPNFILSDSELQDWGGWSKYDVQKFLDDKASYLKNYRTRNVNGKFKRASEIIFDASKEYQINPKFLLVTLQKEQSLITTKKPTQKQLDWATGYAVCDGCNLSDPKVQKHKGFGKQVDDAAGLMRWYYNNKSESYVKKKDVAIKIDKQTVVPESWATAFLYTYTPHLHGNKNFKKIWDSWFGKAYPNGTLLLVDKTKNYYLVQDGKTRKFESMTALLTRRDPNTAVVVNSTELTNYKKGANIALANYSLLRSKGTTYLIDYDNLRPFASADVVRQLGYNPQEIIDVSEATIANYQTGKTINSQTVEPQGVIYEITDDSSQLYLLKDGVLSIIIDESIIKTNFKNLPRKKKLKADLKKFELTPKPLIHNDGTLIRVKNSKLTYVIENGKRRRIVDEETFNGLGYRESNVVTVSLSLALSMPEGERLFVSTPAATVKKYFGDDKTNVKNLANSKLPAYLVAEYPSGKILTGNSIDSAKPIAAFAKLTTAVVALNNNLNLSASSEYRAAKHSAVGNILSLRNGEKINNDDLLQLALVRSVNNATRMLATATGLSEKQFINAANKTFKDWGNKNSFVADTTGLSNKNKMSARDTLKLFTRAMEKPEIARALGAKSFKFKEVINKNNKSTHTVENTNKLLLTEHKNFKVLAGKTGYTPVAGSVLVLLVESKQTKKQYTIITLGESSYSRRFVEPKRLADWAVKQPVNKEL